MDSSPPFFHRRILDFSQFVLLVLLFGICILYVNVPFLEKESIDQLQPSDPSDATTTTPVSKEWKRKETKRDINIRAVAGSRG